MQKIKIGISPCPNDTFIFENLFNQSIAIEGISFDFEFHDIEVLNQKASDGYFDVVKISFANWRNVKEHYTMLKSGGAMGFGVGPLLVKNKVNDVDDEINASKCTVAIPGQHTTANFLFTYFYPYIGIEQKAVVLFSAIEDWVKAGKNRMGLLIHEGRFTYQEKNLELVCDLGKLWEEREKLPIPLGCIVAKKELGESLMASIETAISNSIVNYDNHQKPIISDFIRSHAKEMSEEVMMQHICLYVNDFSRDMGDMARLALERMDGIMVDW
jgi:1,4-dihydroxy-6-naphthoate synthase